MDNMMTPADVAAVTHCNNGGFGFGGEGLWLFAILALMNGGFGGWNNRGNFPGGNPVTEADLCNANSFSELKGQVGRMNDQQAAIARQTDNAICQLGYQDLDHFAQLGNIVQGGFNETQRQNADCCCRIERGIDSVNYNGAMNTAAINANTTAQIQKVLDTLCGNRMADMQNQINQLQLQAALCGVVRYPTTTTFASPCNPFFGGFGFSSCGHNCNNI